jgi:hypothetical protein
VRYFNTNAGKAVLCVTLAAFLLAVPIALPWIAAAALLQSAAKYLKLAFREYDHELSIHASVKDGGETLPDANHGERVLTGSGHDLVRTRS